METESPKVLLIKNIPKKLLPKFEINKLLSSKNLLEFLKSKKKENIDINNESEVRRALGVDPSAGEEIVREEPEYYNVELKFITPSNALDFQSHFSKPDSISKDCSQQSPQVSIVWASRTSPSPKKRSYDDATNSPNYQTDFSTIEFPPKHKDWAVQTELVPFITKLKELFTIQKDQYLNIPLVNLELDNIISQCTPIAASTGQVDLITFCLQRTGKSLAFHVAFEISGESKEYLSAFDFSDLCDDFLSQLRKKGNASVVCLGYCEPSLILVSGSNKKSFSFMWIL